jgi:hypothetical protein
MLKLLNLAKSRARISVLKLSSRYAIMRFVCHVARRPRDLPFQLQNALSLQTSYALAVRVFGFLKLTYRIS